MQLLIFLRYLSTERRYRLIDSLNIIPFTKHKVKHFWKKIEKFFDFFEFFILFQPLSTKIAEISYNIYYIYAYA